MSLSESSPSSLATLTYPRTGKRGVPQQFPRRLYEMLESEAKLAQASPNETFVISWSESGKAFRILDVEHFAETILPRYFRTKKFSSFQRNLNLYGFTKVRRGPDTDMYAHPSFIRGEADLLTQLRKSTSGSRRRLSSSKRSGDESDNSSDDGHITTTLLRSVSPSPTRLQPAPLVQQVPRLVLNSPFKPPVPSSTSSRVGQTWLTFNEQPMAAPTKNQPTILNTARTMSKAAPCGESRLHLLALAIEQGEICGI